MDQRDEAIAKAQAQRDAARKPISNDERRVILDLLAWLPKDGTAAEAVASYVKVFWKQRTGSEL